MQFLSPDAFLMSTHGNVYRYRLIVMKKIIINGSYINGTIAKKIEIFIGGVAHTSDTPNCNMFVPWGNETHFADFSKCFRVIGK
jgi:hypothetical protein